ncbi:MAG: PDZ domain-containing protein [Nitrospina sp.]|nr:PDZ domain-containing protein [Nitrospina sp.]
MNPNPVTQSIRTILATLFLFWLLVFAREGYSEEFAVPNHGSPYLDLGGLGTGQILHLPTGTVVSLKQMMDSISASRVIYIGETHDNIEAHKVQLRIIQLLTEKYQLAIGLEMFRRSAQEKLNLWHQGQLSQKEFKNLFHANWGKGFNLYQPIFEFAQSKNLPLIGLKSTREVENTFRAGDPAPGDKLYPEIDETDPYHRAFAMSAFGGHKGTAKALEKPYRMLLLWEETMAQTVSEFLRNPANKDKKLVVLAGGFHIQYGFGIPKRAYRRMPHNYSIVQPSITEIPEDLKDREMTVEKVFIPLYASDYAWKVEYKVPGHNKVKLGVRLVQEKEGVRIKFVAEKSNAQTAGMKNGDLLLSMDGTTLSGVDDVLELLGEKNFDDHSTFQLQRNTETLTVEVVFKKSEK